MSDAVILGLSLGAFTMITTLVTILLNGSVSRRQARLLHELKLDTELTKSKIDDTKTKIDETNKKVDDYHKETNSKLSQLVVAEKGVSFAEGKEQGRAQQIISDKGNQPVVSYDTEKDKPEEKATGTGVKKNLEQAKGKIDEAKKKLDDL